MSDVKLGVIVFSIGAIGLVGWALNIATLMGMSDLDVEAAVRIAGIFIAPLGAILGYF